MENKTTAQTIAAEFGDDGQVFRNADDVGLDERCRDESPTILSDQADNRKYIFDDESVITVCGACWDFGYLEDWCMDGEGHVHDNQDCAHYVE